MNMQKIRQAILANRGGFEKAGDSEIMMIWNSLDADTQKQYSEKVKNSKKGAKQNAVST